MVCFFVIMSRVQDQDLVPHNMLQLKRAFARYFRSSSFMGDKFEKVQSEQLLSSVVPDTRNLDVDGEDRRLLVIPNRNKDDSTRGQYESFNLALWKLRDQVFCSLLPFFIYLYRFKSLWIFILNLVQLVKTLYPRLKGQWFETTLLLELKKLLYVFYLSSEGPVW